MTTVSTIKVGKRGSLPGYKSSVFARGALRVQYVLYSGSGEGVQTVGSPSVFTD